MNLDSLHDIQSSNQGGGAESKNSKPPKHKNTGKKDIGGGQSRLARSNSSRISQNDSESQEYQQTPQNFKDQFLMPQLGSFKSPKALQQRSNNKEDTKKFDNLNVVVPGRLTVGVDQLASAGVKPFDANLRRPRIVRMKPKKKNTLKDQRNSLDVTAGQQDADNPWNVLTVEELANAEVDRASEG